MSCFVALFFICDPLTQLRRHRFLFCFFLSVTSFKQQGATFQQAWHSSGVLLRESCLGFWNVKSIKGVLNQEKQIRLALFFFFKWLQTASLIRWWQILYLSLIGKVQELGSGMQRRHKHRRSAAFSHSHHISAPDRAASPPVSAWHAWNWMSSVAP